MPTARRNDAQSEHLPCLYQYFELSYAGVRARLETHISTQSAGALKLGIQVRFHRPLTVARPNAMSKTPEWP
jgi:hypothetical protein